MSTKFKIVVPAFNCEKWILKCLFSIKNQVYSNYKCVIYDDASSDNTGVIIDDFIKLHGDHRFMVVHNQQNKKTLYNLIDGFNKLNSKAEPESVLVVVDGDDYLFSEYSLAIVAQVYQERNPLMTYGSFIMWPTGQTSFAREFPSHVISNNDYRNYKFISSHLRTYKSKLWNSIKDDDLRDVDGEYYKVACDVATMIPMLEMSGGNFVYIPNVLYVYNRWNPISDDIINSGEQNRIDKAIRQKLKYDVIK